jgi:hypothetical protein
MHSICSLLKNNKKTVVKWKKSKWCGCLTGALDRSRLSVTIRNSTCQVDSRFVSNHDFHEVCYCIEV